jgi:hypothetical protein
MKQRAWGLGSGRHNGKTFISLSTSEERFINKHSNWRRRSDVSRHHKVHEECPYFMGHRSLPGQQAKIKWQNENMQESDKGASFITDYQVPHCTITYSLHAVKV